MKPGAWLYVRCLIRNRFSFLGCALILFGVSVLVANCFGIEFFDLVPMVFKYVGGIFQLAIILTGITFGGLQTYVTYQRTMAHIQKFKKIDSERVMSLYRGYYCDRVGVKLAIKDAKAKKLIK